MSVRAETEERVEPRHRTPPAQLEIGLVERNVRRPAHFNEDVEWPLEDREATGCHVDVETRHCGCLGARVPGGLRARRRRTVEHARRLQQLRPPAKPDGKVEQMRTEIDQHATARLRSARKPGGCARDAVAPKPAAAYALDTVQPSLTHQRAQRGHFGPEAIRETNHQRAA